MRGRATSGTCSCGVARRDAGRSANLSRYRLQPRRLLAARKRTQLVKKRIKRHSDVPGKVRRCTLNVGDSEMRTEATEALRGLVDAITLTPDEGEIGIELKGNLAAMLSAATNAKRSPETGDLLLQVQMVAGACNPLNLEFLDRGLRRPQFRRRSDILPRDA